MKQRPKNFVHPDIGVLQLGIRDHRFKEFIRCLLKFSILKESDTSILLDEYISVYEQAFTHPTANSRINYEFLEFLGDLTLNKAIGWIMARKFPQLHQPRGVKVLSRLKINLVSKKVFATIAERLHFGMFVSSDRYASLYEKEDLLEDCFEAFFGATEMLVDRMLGEGVGYAVCVSMIQKFLNYVPISLKYEDLYDSKTRLKEVFDKFKDEIGTLKYESIKEVLGDDERPIFKTLAYRIPIEDPERRIDLGYGEHHILVESEKIAAEQAIIKLSESGYTKPVPAFYQSIL